MGKRRRKTVQWTPEAKATRVAVKPLRPYAGVTTDYGADERYTRHLVIGALWRTRGPLAPDRSAMGHYQPHAYDYLIASWPGDHGLIPEGTIAVYAGEVRVEESRFSKRLPITSSRPSFIVDGVRYITVHLTHFEPVLS